MVAKPLPDIRDGEWHRMEVYQRDDRRIIWRDGILLCEVCEERAAALMDHQHLRVCRLCAVAESEAAA